MPPGLPVQLVRERKAEVGVADGAGHAELLSSRARPAQGGARLGRLAPRCRDQPERAVSVSQTGARRRGRGDRGFRDLLRLVPRAAISEDNGEAAEAELLVRLQVVRV